VVEPSMSVNKNVTVPLGSALTRQSMRVNRLAEETSPSASYCDADLRGRAGFASATVDV
jgi:hypothetical protein